MVASEQPSYRPSFVRFWGFIGSLLLVFIAAYSYLLKFGMSTGLDSLSPAFRSHWYPVMALNLLVLWPTLAVLVLRVAHTRCARCKSRGQASTTANDAIELQHLWTFITLTVLSAVVLMLLFLVI